MGAVLEHVSVSGSVIVTLGRCTLAALTLGPLTGCGGAPASPTPPPPSYSGSWDTPTLLEGSDKFITGSDLVVDGSGRAFAAWGDEGGLWSSVGLPSTGWGPRSRLDAAPAGNLRVAVNASGSGVITFFLDVGRSSGVFAKPFSIGGAVGPGVRIDAADPRADFANSYLGAVVDPSGNATVLWVAIGVYASRLAPGGGWSSAELLSPGPAAGMSVVEDGQGNVVAAWMEDFQGLSARFHPAGGWSLEPFDASTDEVARLAALSVDGLGNAVLAWDRQPIFSSTGALWAREGPVVGPSWGPPSVLVEQGIVTTPSSAATAEGTHLLAWQDATGIAAAILAPGGTWSAPAHLPVDQIRDGPSVGIDGQGRALVVWTRWNGTRTEVWGDTLVGGVFGLPVKIDSDGQAEGPVVRVDAQGNGWVIWGEAAPFSRVWANRFRVSSS